jgi:uncharacterized membrane protein
MFGYQGAWCSFSWWWIFPIVMIGIMVLCFFMMRGSMGSMMCRPGSGSSDSHGGDTSGSALDVLNKRDARGEIKKMSTKSKEES